MDIQIEKQMVESGARTEADPDGKELKPVYYAVITKIERTVIDHGTLEAEKDSILARLEEIDAMLGQIEAVDTQAAPAGAGDVAEEDGG